MARIKIQDLPRDMKISQDEMRKVLGGIDTVPLPDMPSLFLKGISGPRFAPRPFTLPEPRPFPRR